MVQLLSLRYAPSYAARPSHCRRLLAVAALLCAACIAPPAYASSPQSKFADEAFNSVNKQRTDAGLPALARLRDVELAAQLHAMDMANREYMEHYTRATTSPVTPDPSGYPGIQFNSGMDPGQRLVRSGASGAQQGWGENIAYNYGYGSGSPADAVSRWMNSQGHRENILRQVFKGAGMGCAVSASGKVYYAEDFVVDTSGEALIAENADLWQSAPIGGDETPPGGWRRFATVQVKRNGPYFRVRVRDGDAGLDVQSADYRYSVDGGLTWTAWIQAACTGEDGTTSEQLLYTPSVPMNQKSRRNRVQFRVRDTEGNLGTSPVYSVPRRTG